MKCEHQRLFNGEVCRPGNCGLMTCDYYEEEERFEKHGIRTKYEELIPFIRAAARAVGYAITLHGSRTRDLDLVAIPWVEDAVSSVKLVEAVIEGTRLANKNIAILQKESSPTHRSHGREIWVIYLGGHDYIDLSIMPRMNTDGIW